MLKITTKVGLDVLLTRAAGQTVVLQGGRTIYVGQPDRLGNYGWTVVAYDEDEGKGYPIENAAEGLYSTLDWIENYGVTVLAGV